MKLVYLISAGSILIGACGPFDIDQEFTPLLQTDSSRYTLRETPSGRVEVEIPYTFENRTGAPVFIVNCHGGFLLVLQKEEGGQWVNAWSRDVPACLHNPIVIDMWAQFSDVVYVSACDPDSNCSPKFKDRNATGVYRIRWSSISALSSFDAYRSPFGEPIPVQFRVSNPFELVDPR